MTPTVNHAYGDRVQYWAFLAGGAKTAIPWHPCHLPQFSDDERFANRRNAKLPKFLPFYLVPQTCTYYIWVNPTHDVVADPIEMCEQAFSNGGDIALFRHTDRNCAYAEANVVRNIGYDNKANIDRQLMHYEREGFPRDFGLFELPCFIMRNTEKARQLGFMWMEQVSRYSSRDQISLPYCLWKLGIEPVILPGYANGYNAQGGIGANELIPQMRHHTGEM